VIDEELSPALEQIAERAGPSGPWKTYSFSIFTIGSLRRSALSASRWRFHAFSFASSSLRAASHTSRDTTFGISIFGFSMSLSLRRTSDGGLYRGGSAAGSNKIVVNPAAAPTASAAGARDRASRRDCESTAFSRTSTASHQDGVSSPCCS
jgi:hypothetical protein